MEDTRSVAREINDLISGSNRLSISDDELLASLETNLSERENNLVNQLVSVPVMPTVPVTTIHTAKSSHVDMMRELEAI